MNIIWSEKNDKKSTNIQNGKKAIRRLLISFRFLRKLNYFLNKHKHTWHTKKKCKKVLYVLIEFDFLFLEFMKMMKESIKNANEYLKGKMERDHWIILVRVLTLEIISALWIILWYFSMHVHFKYANYRLIYSVRTEENH